MVPKWPDLRWSVALWCGVRDEAGEGQGET